MGDSLSAGNLLARRYRLIDQIGAGGMSVIWRARDEVLDRVVALKVLAPELAADQRYRDLVREEARSAAQLVHPNVTAVHDYGDMIAPDGEVTAFVVMELLSGESLERRLTAGPLPWPEALEVCAQVAEALAAAHRIGVVHRDITPGNIMLTEAGVKVLDFGIATRVGAPDDDEDGGTFGTPAYVPPERLDGKPSQPATDTYALGVLLYETLTGRVPYPADTWEDLARTPRHGRPPAPSFVPGLPPEVAELCRRCLSHSPLDRPTARQVAEELKANLPKDGDTGRIAGTRPSTGPVTGSPPSVPAPALPELPAAVLHLPQRLIPLLPAGRRTAASPAPTRIYLPGTAPHAPHSPAERAGGPGRTLTGRPQHAAPEDPPARRPARTWVRVTTSVAAAVVALVTVATVASTLRDSGQPRDGALAPAGQGPAGTGVSPTAGASPTGSPGPTAAAAPPTAGTSPTARPGPGSGTNANALPSIGDTINAISQIIDAGLVAQEIRPDAAVDLRNVMQRLRDSVSRGTPDVPAQVANLQSKVDARRREGAITGGSADRLDTELARLASY
jgi:serine/threonine-protein kinase